MCAPFIPFHRQPFIDLRDGILGQWVIGEVFDWLTNQFSAIHEDSTSVALNQNSIVRVIADHHLCPSRVGNSEQKFVGGVVAIGFGRKAVFVGDRMLSGAADRGRTSCLSVQL